MADMETQQVAVRLSLEVVRRIDEYAASAAPPGVTMARSDAIRALLELGLAATKKRK